MVYQNLTLDGGLFMSAEVWCTVALCGRRNVQVAGHCRMRRGRFAHVVRSIDRDESCRLERTCKQKKEMERFHYSQVDAYQNDFREMEMRRFITERHLKSRSGKKDASLRGKATSGVHVTAFKMYSTTRRFEFLKLSN